MDYIVWVFTHNGLKPENEYRHYLDLDDAKDFADRTAKRLKSEGLDYSVEIYERTNY